MGKIVKKIPGYIYRLRYCTLFLFLVFAQIQHTTGSSTNKQFSSRQYSVKAGKAIHPDQGVPAENTSRHNKRFHSEPFAEITCIQFNTFTNAAATYNDCPADPLHASCVLTITPRGPPPATVQLIAIRFSNQKETTVFTLIIKANEAKLNPVSFNFIYYQCSIHIFRFNGKWAI